MEKWITNCEKCELQMEFYSRQAVQRFCPTCRQEENLQLTNSYLKAKDAGEVA